MQLRGWGPSRASRIVIILLVVQHLGLAQVLTVAPATSTGIDSAHGLPAIAALDVDLPLPVQVDPAVQTSAVIREFRSPATLPEPVPPSCWLPRAPPAA